MSVPLIGLALAFTLPRGGGTRTPERRPEAATATA
jgi:hypothetical protein